MRKLTLVLLALLSLCAFAEDEKIIRVAAIDWCPQLCLHQEDKGYILDIVEAAFEGTGYRIKVEVYPWSRSLVLTKAGYVDAILAPAKAEAPNLLYPEHEVGAQSMCFFTEKTNPWTFSSIDSLQNLQFGIATDTSIEELNQYVSDNPQQFQFQPYFGGYIHQQARKVMKDRIDAFLFTKNSTVYELTRLGLISKFKISGCVSKTNVYMAFSSNPERKNVIRPLMELFDSRMETIRNSDTIPRIMEKYGLKDWR